MLFFSLQKLLIETMNIFVRCITT